MEDEDEKVEATDLYSEVSNLRECTNYFCWIQVLHSYTAGYRYSTL